MRGLTIFVAALCWSLGIGGVPPGFREKPIHYLEPCGNSEQMAKECFKDFSFHLMDFLQTTKVVLNKAEIKAKCTVFNRGLNCFDANSVRCPQNLKDTWHKDKINVARKFFKKFCCDKDFQHDYLNHKDCFTSIRVDCSTKFENPLTDNLNNAKGNKNVHFCCTRNTHKKCISKSSRTKCNTDSTEHPRESETVLSVEEHFTDCRQFDDMSSHAGRNAFFWSAFIALASMLVNCYMRNGIGG